MEAQRREGKTIGAYSIKNRWHPFREEQDSLIRDTQKLRGSLKYNTLNFEVIDLMGKRNHPFKMRSKLQKNRRYRLLFKVEPFHVPEFEQCKNVALKYMASFKSILLNYDRNYFNKYSHTLESYLKELSNSLPLRLEDACSNTDVKKCG